MHMKSTVKNAIEHAIEGVYNNYHDEELLIRKSGLLMPQRDVVIEIISDLRNVLFPGYFRADTLDNELAVYYVGRNLAKIYDDLSVQIECAMRYKNEDGLSEEEIEERTEAICIEFFGTIPYLQNMLLKDIQAGFDGDPAAKSKEEIIFSYPGFFAILVYRIAHELYTRNVPLIPRIMSEYAHNLTGIDINPGATIGEYFFIDHGTGVVIGETTEIGKHVKLYQGVTLGALSTRDGQKLSGVKRHPTIEDNVTIYSGASVLGGDTVIGESSTIGGNAFITSSIPKYAKVSVNNPELAIKTPGERNQNRADWELV